MLCHHMDIGCESTVVKYICVVSILAVRRSTFTYVCYFEVILNREFKYAYNQTP